MARNSEKAMTALARWRRGKEEEEGGGKKIERRPYLGKDLFYKYLRKSLIRVLNWIVSRFIHALRWMQWM